MFCYLFMLNDRTSISCHDRESCEEDCKYFKDGCTIATVKDEALTDNKFSWMLDYTVVFDNPIESKTKHTRYLSAVCIVHPSYSDIVIVLSQRRANEEAKWKDNMYRIHFGSDVREFKTLEEVNFWLARKCYYDGRKISEKDFLLKSGEEDARN